MDVLIEGQPVVGRPVLGHWSVRVAGGTGGRPALEVYQDGELIDVLVATTLGVGVLRGARRGSCGGFAWGRVDADGSVPSVAFATGRLRPGWQPAETVLVPGGFWLARVSGPALAVLARRADGNVERLRPSRVV